MHEKLENLVSPSSIGLLHLQLRESRKSSLSKQQAFGICPERNFQNRLESIKKKISPKRHLFALEAVKECIVSNADTP